jgi:hypothetical protein
MNTYSYLLGYEMGLEKVGMSNPDVYELLKKRLRASRAGIAPAKPKPPKTKKVETGATSETQAAPAAAPAPKTPNVLDRAQGWTSRHPNAAMGIGLGGTAAGVGAGALLAHHDK